MLFVPLVMCFTLYHALVLTDKQYNMQHKIGFWASLITTSEPDIFSSTKGVQFWVFHCTLNAWTIMARQLIHSQDFEVCQMGTMEVSVSKMTFF